MKYDELQSTRETLFPQYLLILDDDKLYSAHSVVENAVEKQIFAETDDRAKAMHRLATRFSKMFDSPDGEIDGPKGTVGAWFGARIKLLLPESALPAARRAAIVDRLEAVLAEKKFGKDLFHRLRRMEEELTAIREAKPWPVRAWRAAAARMAPLRAARKRILASAAGAAVLATVLIWAWQRGPRFEPDPERANRLAILPCGQSDPVFYSALTMTLDSSRHVRARAVNLEALGPIEPCGRLEDARLAKIAQALKAPFLVWGRAERRGASGFRFAGWLYQRDRGARFFRASAHDRFDLAEAVSNQALALLGFESDMIAARPFYSINPAANLLFSEGEVYVQEGHFTAAAKVFERSSQFFDPEFTYGQTKMARALIVKGDFLPARAALARIMAQNPDELHPRVRLAALEHLAHLHYLDFAFDELAPLLVEAKGLAQREDPEAYPFFVRLEAKMHLARGNPTMADALIAHGLDYARQLADPAAPLMGLITEAEAAVKRRDYAEAFRTLDEALALAREVASVAEEVDVMVEIAELALRTRTNYDLALALIEGVYPRLVGTSAADGVELRYREGQIRLALGEFDAGATLLRAAYREAADLGLFFLECLARIRLAEQFLQRKDMFEVNYIMEPLSGRMDQAPPAYRRRYESVMWQYFLAKNQYPEALAHLQEHLALAKITMSSKEVGRALNAIGAVHQIMGELENAERFYLKAYEVKKQGNHSTLRSTILNLIALYDQLGEKEKMNQYRDLLGED